MGSRKKSVKIPLGDGSVLIVHHDTRGVIEHLYHELPMEGAPPCASALTNLHFLIPAISSGKPPFRELCVAIAKAIYKDE